MQLWSSTTSASGPEVKAIPTKEVVHVADFLYDLFMRDGFPNVLISDQGREYCNSVCRLLLEITGPLTACPRTVNICSSQTMISYIHKVRLAMETRFSEESFYAAS